MWENIEIRKTYHQDTFPWCFDTLIKVWWCILVQLSRPILHIFFQNLTVLASASEINYYSVLFILAAFRSLQVFIRILIRGPMRAQAVNRAPGEFLVIHYGSTWPCCRSCYMIILFMGESVVIWATVLVKRLRSCCPISLIWCFTWSTNCIL